MFRVAVRPLAVAPRRTFVSSVLLTRTWENESIPHLRKEAKNRGLTAYVPPNFTHNFIAHRC